MDGWFELTTFSLGFEWFQLIHSWRVVWYVKRFDTGRQRWFKFRSFCSNSERKLDSIDDLELISSISWFKLKDCTILIDLGRLLRLTVQRSRNSCTLDVGVSTLSNQLSRRGGKFKSRPFFFSLLLFSFFSNDSERISWIQTRKKWVSSILTELWTGLILIQQFDPKWSISTLSNYLDLAANSNLGRVFSFLLSFRVAFQNGFRWFNPENANYWNF